MRQLGLMFLAVALVLALAPAASAQPAGLYFTPKIGYSHLQTKTDGTYWPDGDPQPPSSNITNGSYNKGQVALGLAVGYDFKPAHDVPLRAEFEYAWRGKKEMYSKPHGAVSNGPGAEFGIETAKAGAQSFFFNGYFDIHNDTPVTPYIGAGLGFALVSIDHKFTVYNAMGPVPAGGIIKDISKTKTNFAWNIGAGAAWKITDLVSLDLGYRFADFGKVSVINNVDADGHLYNLDVKTKSHDVMLGLRFTF